MFKPLGPDFPFSPFGLIPRGPAYPAIWLKKTMKKHKQLLIK